MTTVGVFLNDGVEARVCAEIAKRQSVGLKKYGVGLSEAGLSHIELLQHAKEEALDLAMYLQTLIDNLENSK